jgi:hypothetical protein
MASLGRFVARFGHPKLDPHQPSTTDPPASMYSLAHYATAAVGAIFDHHYTDFILQLYSESTPLNFMIFPLFKNRDAY